MSWERCAAGTYYLPLTREQYLGQRINGAAQGVPLNLAAQ
jgi:hypothetical protein